MVVSGAMALLPVAAVQGLTGTAPWTAATVGGLIFIGVACTAVAYGLFNAGLRTVPSGAASILTLWEPLTAAVLAVLLVGETLSPAALVGSALLLGSVMLSYLR
jgi:DME family drug/metabolite transporter